MRLLPYANAVCSKWSFDDARNLLDEVARVFANPDRLLEVGDKLRDASWRRMSGIA